MPLAQRYLHPIEQWFNSNGRPQAGAKLHFYDSGTSTPRATYTNEALTTPNANPVIASSAGVWGPIWLDGEPYKVILTDADDVTIWTADPVYGLAGRPASGVYDNLINVMDGQYDAVGDGATDDLDAWNAAIAAANDAGGGAIYAPPGTYKITKTLDPITASGVVIFSPGMATATIRLEDPDDPGNSQIFHIGDASLDPEEGESGRPPGQPFAPTVRDITLQVSSELWHGLERRGPYDAETATHVVTFSAVVTERYNHGLILNGRPLPPKAYTVTGFGTATLTYTLLDPVPGTLWAFRQGEKAWAFDIQGATQPFIERVRFLGVSGIAREGFKQRNNGTRLLDTQAGLYAYRFPGALNPAVAVDDISDTNEEDNTVAPHPGWSITPANEAADGSRTEFTFTLLTPSASIGTLVGIEELAYAEVDGVAVSAVDYDSSGWGTTSITIDFDLAPGNGVDVELWHYVIPVGLPNSWWVMHNSGPQRIEGGHWTGGAGDHRMGGAVLEYRPTNGYTPSLATAGGATGDTKLIQQFLAQGFWSPHASSISWETATAAEVADGSRVAFTFTFAAPVVFGLFRPFLGLVAPEATEWSVSGYGTTSVVVTFDTAPEAGTAVTGRRLFDVEPLGKPFGILCDYTEGHVSNMFLNGSVIDHTTDAAICIRTEPYKDGIPYREGGEYRGFFRFGLFHHWRKSVDAGQFLRIEALTDEPCAGIDILDIVTWRRRAEALVVAQGNYSGLGFTAVFPGELPSADRRPRPGIFSFEGNDGWWITGGGAGKIGRALYSPAQAVVDIVNPRTRLFAISGACYPAGSGGYAALINDPRSISSTQNLGSDPLSFVAEGSQLLQVAATAHGLKVGDEVVLAGATAGGGLPADSINGTYLVFRIRDDDTFRILAGDIGTSTAAFGGSSIVLTKQQADYIRADASLVDCFETASGDATVTVNHTAHGARNGDVVQFTSVESAVGGLDPEDLEGYRVATVVDADSYTVEADTTATSTDTVGGGGDVEVTYWGDRSVNRVVSGSTPSPGAGQAVLNLPVVTAADLSGRETDIFIAIALADEEEAGWKLVRISADELATFFGSL